MTIVNFFEIERESNFQRVGIGSDVKKQKMVVPFISVLYAFSDEDTDADGTQKHSYGAVLTGDETLFFPSKESYEGFIEAYKHWLYKRSEFGS